LLRTVKIGEAIDFGELATRKRLTIPATNLRICGKVRDRTADVARRFGYDECGCLTMASRQLASLTP
jgi:hypothetical protein